MGKGFEMKNSDISSYFTGELARISVTVNFNYGLSEAVVINALTGVMHKAVKRNGNILPLCSSVKNILVPNESEAIVRSLPCVSYRACRLCENLVVKGV